jgi:hypothetical protein
MAPPYREFATWTMSDLAFRETEHDRITFRGNHISHQYVFPIRCQGETPGQFAIRMREFRKNIPRYSDLSERLALAMRALVLAGEKTENAAHDILEILRRAPVEKREEYAMHGIEYAFRPIDAPIGSTRRGHRTKRKKLGITSDERQANSIRAQARRYMRTHDNFKVYFKQRFESFRQQFRQQLQDVEWYAAAEKDYVAMVEEFERRSEPFDWFIATPVAVAAQLFHEQRKCGQALLYYRKAIGAARRAVMDEGLRAFLLHWFRVEVKLCKHSAGIAPIPPYFGPRLPAGLGDIQFLPHATTH